jgi:murein DD-endopeptidase MepM/ murein hydrolase activator NlpD
VRIRATFLAVFLLAVSLVGAARPGAAAARPLGANRLLAFLPRESAARGVIATYTVQQGDSLLGIAELLAVGVDRLQQDNGLSNPDALQEGLVLVVPDVPDLPVRYGVPRPPARANPGGVDFIWPAIGPITTPFGVPGGDWIGGFHMGLDIGAPSGSPIVAAADGIVEAAEFDHLHGYGNYVLIDHSKGYETLYGHMSRFATTAGATVHQGDVIGYVGSSGYANGPHLHFEVRHFNEKIDPQPLLP